MAMTIVDSVNTVNLGRPIGSVEAMAASSLEVVQQLSGRGFSHLYIDGGKTIQGFLGEGLIQQLIITTIPVLIGSGIPLFGPLPHDIRLRLIQTHAFDNGLTQSTYEVCK